MKDFYLSAAHLPAMRSEADAPARPVTWAERKGGYLWCLWDIAPSPDIMRAPLTSGYAANKGDMVAVASMLGMARRLRTNPDHHINQCLIDLMADTTPFYSASGRRWAVWASPISYLLGQSPLALRDKSQPQPLNGLTNGTIARRPASFLHRYLARQRLAAKAARPHSKQRTAIEVRIVYARDRYQRDTCHRVIKRTSKHLAVDILPYRPAAFLHPKWRYHLVDIALLPSAAFDRDGCMDHRPSSRTYYAAPPSGFRLYDEAEDPDFDAFMNEHHPQEHHFKPSSHADPLTNAVEVPENALDWALTVLEITPTNWPLSITCIKSAYRLSASKHHPDRGGEAADFRAVRAAYELLCSLTP